MNMRFITQREGTHEWNHKHGIINIDFSKSGTQAFQKELYSCVSMCMREKNEFKQKHIMTIREHEISKAQSRETPMESNNTHVDDYCDQGI